MSAPDSPRRLQLLVGALVCVIGGCFLVAGVRELDRRRRGLGCSDQLRQIVLATIQYSDDKRFFPHLNRLRDLDGDATTNAASKSMRALTYYAYLDQPSNLVCPSAREDKALPLLEPAATERRRWFWRQEYALASVDRSPFVDGAPDPALRDNRELSYQWTRAGHNR